MEDGDGVDAMVTFDERFSKLNGDKKMTRDWIWNENDLLLPHLLLHSCLFVFDMFLSFLSFYID